MKQAGLTISFCIVCMNRMHHLKKTILKNISDNSSYDNLEFVLLDYNSQDDMEEWVKENLSQYISSGKVVYYKTLEPTVFRHSHSKNMALKLANSEIVCSINADHFAGKNFAHYVNESFSNDGNIVLTPIPQLFFTKNNDYPPGDVWGLVCVQKNDFLKTRGFDERMINYGNEDIDFIHRLEMLDVKRVPVKRSFLSGFIAHSDQERHSSIRKTDRLYTIYALQLSPASSEFIFLYKDGTFEKVTVIDNISTGSGDYRHSYMPKNVTSHFSFLNAGLRGRWEEDIHGISFADHNDHQYELLKVEGGLRTENSERAYCHLNDEMMENVFNFYYFGYNTSLMQQNMKEKAFAVNVDSFGKAVVYKNFDYNNAISV